MFRLVREIVRTFVYDNAEMVPRGWRGRLTRVSGTFGDMQGDDVRLRIVGLK